MKKVIFILLGFLCFTIGLSAKNNGKAESILNKAAANLRNAGGLKVSFQSKSYTKNRLVGETKGTIQMKSTKFLLKIPEAVTWFDGITQWSYLSGSEEVNVSTPTEAELNNTNPYLLLYMYKKGYSYRMGNKTSFQGKAIYEVMLTAKGKKQNIAAVTLYIAKKTYQPLYIIAEQQDKSRVEITVTGYQAKQKYADSLFAFNKKLYPNSEIIDLR